MISRNAVLRNCAKWSRYPPASSACCGHTQRRVEDGDWIEASLKFRKAVSEEFEHLLCAGAEGIDLPEVDDGELDPVEQGSAAA
jgi:hypothetical protein